MQLERPKTQASLALSGAASISSAGASSLDGSKLNALVARRSALRSQLASVEQQLAVLPPSSAASAPRAQGADSARGNVSLRLTGPLPDPITKHQTPPRDASALAKQTVQLEPKRSAGFVAAASSRAEESLPGAMLPGRYAFWPKRLPSGASRQSRATKGSSGSLSARGVAATAAPAVPQPLLAPL